jgi:bacterioferritin-associated ferredoxin
MYICLCHAVTDSAIRKAANEGVRTLKELSFRTGCGTQCGSCANQARQLIEDTVAELASESTEPNLGTLRVA